jgi:Flp pilus assembly protein TadG
VIRLLRDTRGSILVETTVVLPLFLVLVLGSVDAAYLFFDWHLASKAAYIGARAAIVLDPVAQGITTISYSSDQQDQLGRSCLGADGQPQVTAQGNNFCVSGVSSTCTVSGGTVGCSNGYSGYASSFTNDDGTGIYDQMKVFYSALQPRNVTITYSTNGAGFVGGQLFNVDVRITGMQHQFLFISGLIRVFGSSIGGTVGMPAFASTLVSEDLTTN